MVNVLGTATRHGTVSQRPLDLRQEVAETLPVRVRHTLPLHLAERASPTAAVELDVLGGVGWRRFWPVGGAERFIQSAWEVGLAFLSEDAELTDEERLSYFDAMWLFHVTRSRRRKIRRSLGRIDELSARDALARRGEESLLLPEDLGLDSQGLGVRWGISRLLAEGRDRAAQDGFATINEPMSIRYGLLAAAERNPFKPPLDQEASAPIVRLVLHDDLQLEERLPWELTVDVADRWIATLSRRLHMPLKDMLKGLIGRHNNLATAVSRLKTDRRITTAQADAGLMECGWRSYLHMAMCINCWAAHFAEALPFPLTPEERLGFDFMYRARTYFGGLPPILFSERLELLEPILPQLELHPDDPVLIGTAQKVLHYYGQIVAARRSVDRNKKRDRPRQKKRTDALKPAAGKVDRNKKRDRPRRTRQTEDPKPDAGKKVGRKEVTGLNLADLPAADADENQTDDEAVVSRNYDDVDLQTLARRILAARGTVCPGGCDNFKIMIAAATEDKNTTDVTCRCRRHKWSERQQITFGEFRNAAERK